MQRVGLTVLTVVLLRVLEWIGRWAWAWFRGLRIEIHQASAEYLAYGVRMPAVDEGSVPGGMVSARVPVAVADVGSPGNVQLVISVRLGLHNRGPVSRRSSI